MDCRGLLALGAYGFVATLQPDVEHRRRAAHLALAVRATDTLSLHTPSVDALTQGRGVECRTFTKALLSVCDLCTAVICEHSADVTSLGSRQPVDARASARRPGLGAGHQLSAEARQG